jgi:5'-nucleotidase/2',3'-cyclic-nucleotide 2'-phosphodiesterase/3'-nucleotidase/5'-nucleotidase
MGSILDRLLARHTRGIDVIVGGDSHDALHGVQPGNTLLNGKDGQPVLVMQAGCNGQWVGVADLVFDNQGHLFQAKNQLIPSRTFPADGDTEQLIAKAIGEKQVIVQLTTPYNNDGIRTQNDPVAQLAADAMRMATSADIAFVRSREIRESLPAGPLTNWALKTLMPYANPVVVLPVSGEEIIQSLSRAAYGIGHPLGKPSPLLHPSGLTATLDPETGKVSHARVLSWKTGQWSPVEPKTMYIVALGEYAVRNRNPGEFPELAHPERITHNTGLSLRDFFTQALTNLSPDGRPVVIPPAQPRLTIQQ